MIIRLVVGVLLVCCLSSHVFGQQTKLEGHVFNESDGRVRSVRVLAAGGQAATTDSRGHFVISFPSTVEPGQATRITVDRKGWVVYEPMLGNCITQNAARNFEPLKVIIVPKGSPLALGPKRLIQVINRWANERAKLRREVDRHKSQLEEYAFIKEYAENYGFTLDQFLETARQWALTKDSDDKEVQALKEYVLKNYDLAARLARESALDADAELERINNQEAEVSAKVIRRFKLEGNARFVEDKFREALAAYEEIDKRFTSGKLRKDDLIGEWAEVKILKGNSKQELGTRVEGQESQSLLSQAVADYQQAFTVYTREQLPHEWASTQNNLGIVLLSQGERIGGEDGVGSLRQAAGAFRQALTVYTREQSPQGWATTLNNLGSALCEQGKRLESEEGARLLAQALEAYRQTLTVYTREHLPQDWAATQNNLGIVLFSRAERIGGEEGAQLLGQAAGAFRQALTVYTREQFPQRWAGTQNNLGAVLLARGERMEGEAGTLLFAQAAEAFGAALTVYTRESLPQLWASMQNNLGNALLARGKRIAGVEGARLLTQAADAYRLSLTVYTRDHLPQDWATSQNNLGAALLTQGRRTGGADGARLRAQAVEAFRLALTVRTREHMPQGWATTQTNLGGALRTQSEFMEGEDGTLLLREAAEAYRAALQVRTREHLPLDWAATQNNLGVVLRAQGERTVGKEGERLLTQAAEAYQQALTVYTREHLPQDWAATQHNLGIVLRAQGERLEGAAGARLLGQAVETFRAALQVRTREHLPPQWAGTQTNLAKTYLQLRNWPAAAEAYANVLALYPNNEEAYRQLSWLYQHALFKFDDAFALNEQWLARRPDDVAAQADFAENHFTTGRFAECGRRIQPLLLKPEVGGAARASLRAVEIANLLALRQSGLIPSRMSALIEDVSRQPPSFKAGRTFAGAEHFIRGARELSPHQDWLRQLFDAMAGKDREAMLVGLRQAAASFKE